MRRAHPSIGSPSNLTRPAGDIPYKHESETRHPACSAMAVSGSLFFCTFRVRRFWATFVRSRKRGESADTLTRFDEIGFLRTRRSSPHTSGRRASEARAGGDKLPATSVRLDDRVCMAAKAALKPKISDSGARTRAVFAPALLKACSNREYMQGKKSGCAPFLTATENC